MNYIYYCMYSIGLIIEFHQKIYLLLFTWRLKLIKLKYKNLIAEYKREEKEERAGPS